MGRLVSVLTFVVGFYFALGRITINQMVVPPFLNNEDPPDNVTLDCDFEFSGERNLVVKWYFDNTTNMIYQWIPSRKPESVGAFKTIIDVTYKATDDKRTMYRALHLTRVWPNITGNYYCVVSGDNSEDVKESLMIVYEPSEDGLEVDHDEENNTVTCSSWRLFPRPELTFSIIGSNNSIEEDAIVSISVDTFQENDGYKLFNITGVLVYNETLLPHQATIYCNLTIPNTDYYMEQMIGYKSETFELEEDYRGYPEWFNELNTTRSANGTEYDDNESSDEENNANITSLQENSAEAILSSLPLVLTTLLSVWLRT